MAHSLPLLPEDSCVQRVVREMAQIISVHVRSENPLAVDPISLAQKLGISVRRNNQRVSGGRLNCVGGKWTIFLPINVPASRRRWSCAHELGHYILNSKLSSELHSAIAKMSTGSSMKLEEAICDAFAEELLLPRAELERLLSSAVLTPAGFFKLIRSAETSIYATSRRISGISSSYAFVVATVNRVGPRRGQLAVAWVASPSGVFLPLHKVIPSGTCMHTAFASGATVSMWEDRFLGRLKGTHRVDAAPLNLASGSFGIVHLCASVSSSLQIGLPGFFQTAEPLPTHYPLQLRLPESD